MYFNNFFYFIAYDGTILQYRCKWLFRLWSWITKRKYCLYTPFNAVLLCRSKQKWFYSEVEFFLYRHQPISTIELTEYKVIRLLLPHRMAEIMQEEVQKMIYLNLRGENVMLPGISQSKAHQFYNVHLPQAGSRQVNLTMKDNVGLSNNSGV